MRGDEKKRKMLCVCAWSPFNSNPTEKRRGKETPIYVMAQPLAIFMRLLKLYRVAWETRNLSFGKKILSSVLARLCVSSPSLKLSCVCIERRQFVSQGPRGRKMWLDYTAKKERSPAKGDNESRVTE